MMEPGEERNKRDEESRRLQAGLPRVESSKQEFTD